LGIGGLGDLPGHTLGERHSEQTQSVAIGGLGLDVRVDESLPLLDERVELLPVI
jgi:hypothetical protein